MPDLAASSLPELDRAELRALAARLAGASCGVAVRIEVPGSAAPAIFMLPPAVLPPLAVLLGHLAGGRAVVIFARESTMTSSQAAGVLDVSRLHLVKLLERGEIPHHMAGTHRRVRAGDLAAYLAQRDEAMRQMQAARASLQTLPRPPRLPRP